VGLPLCVQQDVGGLEVAVQQLALVGVVDRPRHLHQQPGRRPRVGAEAVQRAVQAAALDELHAEVVLAVGFAAVIDGDDVGVVEAAGLVCLLAEATNFLLATQVAGPNHLQRHQPVRTVLARPVDDTHSAPTQDAEDVVTGQGREARRARAVRRPEGAVRRGLLLVAGGARQGRALRGGGHGGREGGSRLGLRGRV
jgi:hypothetical protein